MKIISKTEEKNIPEKAIFKIDINEDNLELKRNLFLSSEEFF
jgi:hypothetical protein